MFRRPQRPGVGFANVAGGTSSVDPVLHLLELIIAGSAAGSQGATRPFIGELSRADVGASAQARCRGSLKGGCASDHAAPARLPVVGRPAVVACRYVHGPAGVRVGHQRVVEDVEHLVQ